MPYRTRSGEGPLQWRVIQSLGSGGRVRDGVEKQASGNMGCEALRAFYRNWWSEEGVRVMIMAKRAV